VHGRVRDRYNARGRPRRLGIQVSRQRARSIRPACVCPSPCDSEAFNVRRGLPNSRPNRVRSASKCASRKLGLPCAPAGRFSRASQILRNVKGRSIFHPPITCLPSRCCGIPAMAKLKQFTRPPKKQKAKATAPETADDFQQAADLEEETGGKWRAGDPAKSGRAFVRALEIYDKGLQKHPKSFDLAYNKARLELEVTQKPALVAHVGLPLVDLLKQTLDSHRYALRLNEENPDILFNTSQVLTTLAEQLSEEDDSNNAVPLLQEALELLSACLSRQEMLLEQQQVDFEAAQEEEGGVPLAEATVEGAASNAESEEEGQMATIENPITPSDLLDTLHASLSALTTVMSLADMHALQTYGDMAQSLTETKAALYIALLPAEEQEAARFAVALDRANFIAAFADAQYNAFVLEAETYLARMDEGFTIPGKEQDAAALNMEAEARTEFAVSVLSRFESSPDLPADVCWKQLSLAQDLYTKAVKLESGSQTFLCRGNAEMLRHRIATMPQAKVSDAARKSAPTLAQNAETYYRGAGRLASDDDEDLKSTAIQRMLIAALLRASLYGVTPNSDCEKLLRTPAVQAELRDALVECAEEGLLDEPLADRLAQDIRGN
jgi:hypothetical protein